MDSITKEYRGIYGEWIRMNKKDIAALRRQFKVDNDLLKIKDIFHVYVMKESSEIYHHQSQPFDMLEREQQELFMTNFKKILTGQLDEKLFELRFDENATNSSQLILHKALLSQKLEDWKEQMLQLVEKMLEDRIYDMDVVITFIRGEYLKPSKKSNEETEGSDRDTVYSHSFILSSVNKTEDPRKELLFDYVEKTFKYNVVVDPIINLNAPIKGFLFPCFTNQTADVNHVLYSSGKSNELDMHFVENVLNAQTFMTAQEDKEVFEDIVKHVTNNQLNTSTLANVYEEINRTMEENEEDEMPTLDYKDVEHVLKMSGVAEVNSDKVKAAFQDVIDDNTYEFKASSIMPKYQSKSIKIQTKVANIAISPQDLKYVRQVDFFGKRCLLIEVEEDTVIEGFTMIPEAFSSKDKHSIDDKE